MTGSRLRSKRLHPHQNVVDGREIDDGMLELDALLRVPQRFLVGRLRDSDALAGAAHPRTAALARPTVTHFGALWGNASTAAVIVLDNSASMGLIDGDRSRFETSTAAAAMCCKTSP